MGCVFFRARGSPSLNISFGWGIYSAGLEAASGERFLSAWGVYSTELGVAPAGRFLSAGTASSPEKVFLSAWGVDFSRARSSPSQKISFGLWGLFSRARSSPSREISFSFIFFLPGLAESFLSAGGVYSARLGAAQAARNLSAGIASSPVNVINFFLLGVFI